MTKRISPSIEWHNVKFKGPKRVRLIQERKKRNLTQKELASIIGVSASTITHLENGRTKPGLELSLRLQELFELPYEILFPDL